jgi:hypothetical protein
MAIVSFAQAQNVTTDELTWHVSRLKNLATGEEAEHSFKFVTHGSGSILWIQKNGAYTSELTVSSMSGEWQNVALTGQIFFNVTVDGQTGTLKFERSSNGIFCTIDLSQPNGGRLKHRYTVQSITPR